MTFTFKRKNEAEKKNQLTVEYLVLKDNCYLILLISGEDQIFCIHVYVFSSPMVLKGKVERAFYISIKIKVHT